ncbi:MAG: tRNA pseudouridine(55) synthase TruB [Streptococcaceae bacterium]|jgi:tRNA pseudouridine55 synthase|nr:tRNA pseudouridine(55) synthase TruB [Streptococcaceae bacterium]
MDGILNVYKEAGWTSNDVVQKLRGILRTKKVGHGGTLDPAVTGVLPVAVGKATRLLEYMDGGGKVYKGEVTLGISTETEDAEGAVVEKKAVAPILTGEDVDAAMAAFRGSIRQTPPMYSAVKVKGKKLYEYARTGLTVERPERVIEIKRFERTSTLTFSDEKTASFDFLVACSKGTYVRTLAVDLAARLGYPGHMSRLERTMSNGLTIDSALTLSEIEAARDTGRLEEIFQPMAFAVSELPRVELSESEYNDVRVGKRIQSEMIAPLDAPVAVFYDEQLVGVCLQQENELKAKKILI